LAVVLHKLYAVDWAYTAAGSELNQELTDDDKLLLDVVGQWLNEPNEVNRRLAMESADAGGYESTACWAAAAVGWSGGSLAPADIQVVPPPDDLTSKAIFGCISMIAVQNSAQIEKRAAQLVELGLQFAARRPIPPPLYSGEQEEKPKDTPPQKPMVQSPPPIPPKPVTPPAPAKPVLNPPPPKFVPPRPRTSAPQPPPASPGPWSTDPL
ncbi:MAG: hypothetical protein O7G85_13335, partial [Planctomycetota bacterium]|nr:hypothetical protein [Planctomycetota bacterium]